MSMNTFRVMEESNKFGFCFLMKGPQLLMPEPGVKNKNVAYRNMYNEYVSLCLRQDKENVTKR